MKRFLFILLLTASVACGQTYNVKVDANGNVLHSQLQNTATNPTGIVNYATGKLKVNGVEVTTGGGGGGAPIDAPYIMSIANGTLTNEFALGTLATGLLKNTTGTGIPTIAVPGTDYTSPATTIGGYGITDFNSLGDARWQAKDGDLTSLSDATGTHDIYYRSAANTWNPVVIGPGLRFFGNELSTIRVSGQIETTGTKASAATLDLTGITDKQIEVTGTTPFNAITGISEGDERLLQFSGAGLTITPSATLLTPGGVPIVTEPDGWGRILGGAGGVVTVIDYQTAEGYKRETFGDMWMAFSATIGFRPGGFGFFDIGTKDSPGNFLRFTTGTPVKLVKWDLTGSVELNTDLLTATRNVSWPDKDGTYAYLDDIPTTIVGITGTKAQFDTALTDGTFVTQDGALGTPVSGVATNITGLPLETGVVGNLQLANFNGGLGADAGYVWSTDGATGLWRLVMEAVGDEVRPESSLTTNAVVIGGSFGNPFVQTVAGITTNGVSKMTLGVAGTSVGSIDFKNATSGTITLSPPTGALGTITLSLPIGATTTLVGLTNTQTLTNKTLTTPVVNGLPTGTGVASAATASTLAARDSNGDLMASNLISATAGKGVQIKSGTGARAGEATLVAGTVTVTNSTVTNLSGGVGDIITLTRRVSGGTIGTAITYTISNGTSFTINSDNPLDTSTFNYVITKIN